MQEGSEKVSVGFPIDDGSYETWMQSIHSHPVLGREYLRAQQMHELIVREGDKMLEDVRFGRFRRRIYEPSDLSVQQLDETFRDKAAYLRMREKLLLLEYAGPVFDRFEQESRIEWTSNPIRLIEAAFAANGSDRLSRQRRIRGLTNYMVTSMLLDMGPDVSSAKIDDGFVLMLDTFIGQFFHKNKSEDFNWAAALDPDQSLLAQEVRYAVNEPPDLSGVPSGLVIRSRTTTSRFVDARDGRLIPVILMTGLKDDFDMIVKVIRKGTRPEVEKDMRRFTLIIPRPEDFRQVESRFKSVVSKPPFSIRGDVENISGKSGSARTNSATSDHYRAVRYILDYADPKSGKTVPIEVNLQLLQDFANTIFSDTDVRHSWYRFTQLYPSYLPFVRPRFIFGVDFREGSVDHSKMLAALR